MFSPLAVFAACDEDSLVTHRGQTQAGAAWRMAADKPYAVTFEAHGHIGISDFKIVQPPACGVAQATPRQSAEGLVGLARFEVSAANFNRDFRDGNNSSIDEDVDVGK